MFLIPFILIFLKLSGITNALFWRNQWSFLLSTIIYDFGYILLLWLVVLFNIILFFELS